MTIENQNAYLIQLAVSLSLSAIHQELTEMMDDHEKAKCTVTSASSFIRCLSAIHGKNNNNQEEEVGFFLLLRIMEYFFIYVEKDV